MIVFDTNALYAYCMDFSSRRRDGRLVQVQRRNRDAVVAEVDGAIETGSLKVLDIVAAELLNGLEKTFRAAAKSAGAAAEPDVKIVEAVRARFEILNKRFGTPNHKRYLAEIDRMYADIWSDPRLAHLVARWRRIKEKRGKAAVRPSLETHLADFLILSTAAALAAQGHSVRLLTYDHDLVAFAGVILERFGVVVVDCNSLRR